MFPNSTNGADINLKASCHAETVALMSKKSNRAQAPVFRAFVWLRVLKLKIRRSFFKI